MKHHQTGNLSEALAACGVTKQQLPGNALIGEQREAEFSLIFVVLVLEAKALSMLGSCSSTELLRLSLFLFFRNRFTRPTFFFLTHLI